jgi:zinc transport system substrate-binding protein
LIPRGQDFMRPIATALTVLAGPAVAAPSVVTDIAPINGIASIVMGDLGTPEALIPPGADAHDYALRPSDAGRLANADLVIWVGEGLTPWLLKSMETLGDDATILELLDTDGWEKRDTSKSEDDHHDQEGHDNHKGHDDHEDHDDHADHGDVDPHAWLSPTVAAVWAMHIATALGEADTENAQTYTDNAAAFGLQMDDLMADLSAQLAAFEGATVIWPHDAYGYFADAFRITTAGNIAGINAADPGPAHITELREHMADDNVTCVLADTEIGPSWADLVREGTDAKTGILAPIGNGDYVATIEGMATTIAACLSDV